MRKKLLLVLFMSFVFSILALFPAVSKAGVLPCGVNLSCLHIAGGSYNGNPLIDQFKYQMAIDRYVGIKNRYRSVYISNIYHNDKYFQTYFQDIDNDNTSVNTFVDVDAGIGKGSLSTSITSYGTY